MSITPINNYRLSAILILLTILISLFDIDRVMAARPNYIANESPAADSIRDQRSPLEELQPKKAIQPPPFFPELNTDFRAAKTC